MLSDYEFNESDIEKKKQIKKKQVEEYMILCNDDNEGNKNVASLLQSIFRVIHFHRSAKNNLPEVDSQIIENRREHAFILFSEEK